VWKKILLGLLIVILISLSVVVYGLRQAGLLRAPSYDTDAPNLGVVNKPAILVLSKTNGFIHKEGLPAGKKMLAQLGLKNGWNIYNTDNAASHNSADLAKFDLVVWNNTSGDILTSVQREAFKNWLLGGGKWLGLHAAGGDPSYDWDWYVSELVGAQFVGHTMAPQFQTADVLIKDLASPLTSHLPVRWRVENEEWYAFDRNPSDVGAEILLTLDESTYKTEQAVAPAFMASTELAKTLFMVATMEGEHPIAWSNDIGSGKMIYSAMGHTGATYELPAYREFISRAVNSLIDRE
jgi:type 1 glutamine amidotransferase